ncbi:MAG TPA: pentapeptide repeat-containing protein [Candidatus Saccharimonadales bacterium]|nr:pentapeptide repeat-containing protein [Candidatus Saccharimonadales bacterium]
MGIFTTSVRFLRGQTKLVVGIAAGLLVGGAGTAAVLASVPDTTGVIHACYRGNNVRIIDTATQTCNANETALSWNSATPGQFLTNLVGSRFTNTSLAYRNFAGVDMHGSIFNGVYLDGADFSNANLSSTDFTLGSSNNYMRGTNFSNTNFSSAQFVSPDLTGANLTNTNFTNATLGGGTNGDFRQAILTNTDIRGGYNGANFSHVDFAVTHDITNTSFGNGSNLSSAKFNGLTLTGTLFASADLTNTNFSGATFEGSQISPSILTGTNLANVHFSNSVLSGTDLSGVTLTGATWSNTFCPDNTNSDDNGGTCIGHLTP